MSRFSFCWLPPAISGEDILLIQGEAIIRASGGDDNAVESQQAVQRLAFRALRSDQDWDEWETTMRAQFERGLANLPEESRAAITDVEEFLNTQVNAARSQIDTPWFRYFIDYDPAGALEDLDAPVLAIFGGKDLQVPVDPNLNVMQQIFENDGKTNFRIETLSEANHLFQTALLGAPSEYGLLTKEFTPGLLGLITDWIREETR